MLQEMINFANEIKAMIINGKSLKEISQYSFQQRESGRNVPYLAILNKDSDGILDLSANPTSKQKELNAFFSVEAPNSTLPKYTFFVNRVNGVKFQERLGKGKDNKISLI